MITAIQCSRLHSGKCKTTMKCMLNAEKGRKRRQLEAAARDGSCRRQQQQQQVADISATSSSLPNFSTGATAAFGNPFKNILRIGDGNIVSRTAIEQSLVTIHDIATENLGTLCISTLYRPLQVPINSERFESSRQKADLAASILQEVGIIRHGGEY
ncbi:hypothetical protein ACLKA6_019389 [Drosophila palustris]